MASPQMSHLRSCDLGQVTRTPKSNAAGSRLSKNIYLYGQQRIDIEGGWDKVCVNLKKNSV